MAASKATSAPTPSAQPTIPALTAMPSPAPMGAPDAPSPAATAELYHPAPGITLDPSQYRAIVAQLPSPLDMHTAWGDTRPLTSIPEKIDDNNVLGCITSTPDAKTLVCSIMDRKSDPELFHDIRPQRLVLVDVATRKITTIREMPNSAMQGLFFSDSADADWIVWGEAPDQPTFSDWTIYAFNRTDGQIKPIARAPHDKDGSLIEGGYVRPSVSHGQVVWAEPPVPPDAPRKVIKRADLTTGQISTLTDNGLDPHISWPYVVWTELQPEDSTVLQGAKRGLVVVQNLETGERVRRQQPDTPSFIALYQDTLVWTTGDQKAVYMDHIREGQPPQLIMATDLITNPLGFPSVGERLVTWRSTEEVYAYDRVLKRLVLINPARLQPEPSVNGNAAVWMATNESGPTPPEERGLVPNKGMIQVLDSSKLPVKPPATP